MSRASVTAAAGIPPGIAAPATRLCTAATQHSLHGARRACGGADLESIVTNKGGLRVRPALDNHAVVLQPDIGVALSRCLFHLIGEALSRRCL